MLDTILPKTEHDKLLAVLLNPKKPVEMRAKTLVGMIQGGAASPEAIEEVVQEVLHRLANAGTAAEAAELKNRYQQALKELEEGPARPATYIGPADRLPGSQLRAHVVTPDGQERFPSLHPEVKRDDLAAGMTVYLDVKGTLLLGSSGRLTKVGQQARFQRSLPGGKQVEVLIRDEPAVLYASQQVIEAAEAGEVGRNDRLLVCPQQMFAFSVIPTDEDRRHRFLDNSKIPEVLPGRDIGRPHWSLGWLIRRTKILLFRPDLLESFDLRPRVSLMMIGPSGTGKTLTIKAFLTAFKSMLAERTGRDDLKSRVVRVKMSEQLSEWLGRADKNFEELFDDIHRLAATDVAAANGDRVRLPVVVILEEVDGIARRRSNGEHDGSGGAFDRILSTLLQRLDDPVDDLGRLPLVIISTSNRPSNIDVAMQRRLGAKVARFGRLDREGFAAVLGKKIKPTYPVASQNGHPREELRQRLLDAVVAEFYSPRNDSGEVEVTLRDGAKVVKHARDFLSGAVVESAVSDAIDQLAFYAERTGLEDVGLEAAALVAAVRRQVDALADNVTAYNVADYVDLPDHAGVASVRRLRKGTAPLAQVIAEEENP